MRSLAWKRVCSAALAVALMCVLAGQAALPFCPTHGGETAAGHSGEGHARAAHGHHSHDEGAGSDPTSGSNGCRCLGHACCAVASGLPAGYAHLEMRGVEVASGPRAGTHGPWHRANDYLLPLANGPPADPA